MQIPYAVLRDPRVAPATLASTIDCVVAELERLAATVASMEERLVLDMALNRIGMSSKPESTRAALASESATLDAARQTLAGLRAIEAARNKMQSDAQEREAASNRQIAESRAHAALVLSGEA